MLEILTITLDVLKLWSLSEKQFHINLIGPSFSSSNLLWHWSGFDRSDRSVIPVRPVFPETVSRGPFVGTIFKPPMDLRSSDNISEVLTCTAPDLHHHRIVFTWSDLWIIWRFSLTDMEHSQLYVRLQFYSENVLIPKTLIVRWSLS